MTITERLEKYMNHKDLNPNKVTVDAGLSVGLIGKAIKNNSNLNSDTIEKILRAYEDLSPEWFIIEKGEMLVGDEKQTYHIDKSLPTVRESLKPLKRKKAKEPYYEAEPFISDELINIPLIDIEAAAGNGFFNPDYIEVLGEVSVPANMLSKRNATYYAIRTRGNSMSPTIFDRDLLIIRYLDRGEWQELRDEYVYVVVDRDGSTYVKRLKDRLHRGFLVLMSDNLDKSTYPSFTLEQDELSNLFFTEMKISPYLQNINATYYDRMKILEDDMYEVKKRLKRLDSK